MALLFNTKNKVIIQSDDENYYYLLNFIIYTVQKTQDTSFYL